MIFHRGKRKINLDIPSLNHISLNKTKFTKILGVIIDDQFEMDKSYFIYKNEIAKGFGIILRARKFFNRKILQKFVKFLYISIFNCVEIWGSAFDTFAPFNSPSKENWIKNFLTGRKQRVMVNNTCSEWSEVISGIPQGSVLGSILFIAIINDIVIVNGI